jgi:hypothetical protein
MKKILLSAVALMATMSMNAQVEMCAIDGEAAGANSDGVELAAGTELGKTASVTCTVKYNDTFKVNDNKTMFKVNDADFDLNGKGIQGSTNGPKACWDGTDPGFYPENGCIYQFVASQDGYIYVIHKGSSNKNYVVYEEKTRVPYIYTMINGGIDDLPTPTFGYDLNKIEGATVTDGEGVTTVVETFAIDWPERLAGHTGEDAKKGGNSVIKVPVYAGLVYDVLACGSKMTLGGFLFDTTGDATIYSGENLLLDKGQIPGGSSAGISAVKNNAIDINAMFNLAGQKVSKGYKGVVIMNGRKMIQK